MNMGARLYLPALGRFTSPDVKTQGSSNAYDYANQDPINNSDPTGAMSQTTSNIVSAALQIGFIVLSMFVTDGLSAIGITATAASEAGAFARAGYVAINAGLYAGVALGGIAANNAIFHPNGAPIWDSWMNAVTLTLGTTVAAYTAYYALYALRGITLVRATIESVTADAATVIRESGTAVVEQARHEVAAVGRAVRGYAHQGAAGFAGGCVGAMCEQALYESTGFSLGGWGQYAGAACAAYVAASYACRVVDE
jgi:hypothetical protein